MGCARRVHPPEDSMPVDHVVWDSLVQAHVSEDGWVDYKGFIEDSVRLNRYLNLLSQHHPNKAHWTRDEQLAYWINAYNAFTVQLIIRHYPIKSIRKITWTIPFINTPWKIKFIHIQGIFYSLGQIEHDILRKQFQEPRIHFAINCASYSCPPLLNHAYQANQIDTQLNHAAVRFINDPLRNKISKNKVEVSSIFLWFRGDFTKDRTLKDFLNSYSNIPVRSDQSIKYLPYDWTLNEQ